MKIFSSLLFLFSSLPCLCFADRAEMNPDRTSEPTALCLNSFDYFNFSGMKKSPAGKALRERIFYDLKISPDTEALIKNLNENYALNVPESVERAVIAQFSLPGGGNFNTAEFKFSQKPGGQKSYVEGFFEKLSQQELSGVDSAGRHNSKKSATMSFGDQASAFPPELAKNLPKAFLENTEYVSVAPMPPDTLIVIATAKTFSEIPKFRKTESYIQTLACASRPEILVYRQFERRATEIAGLALSFPPGEFAITEKDDRIRIYVDFRCRDSQEAVFMEHFFLRFKLSLNQSAEKQPENVRAPLLSVGSSLSISREDATLKLRIDCASKDFSAFLNWRSSWFPNPKKTKR